MSDLPTIKRHYGDYVVFLCVCGVEHDLFLDDGDTEPCEGCGRVWSLRCDVVMVRGPSDKSVTHEL